MTKCPFCKEPCNEEHCPYTEKKMRTSVPVKIRKNHPNAIIPEYQTKGAAGFDLHSIEKKVIMQGDTVTIDTGLSMEIPEGFELQVRPRSGISLKTKIRLSNSPGTIDSDFRGSIKIIIDNIGNLPYTVEVGDRIAQGILSSVPRVEFKEVEDVSETERGEGAFGSSGT